MKARNGAIAVLGLALAACQSFPAATGPAPAPALVVPSRGATPGVGPIVPAGAVLVEATKSVAVRPAPAAIAAYRDRVVVGSKADGTLQDLDVATAAVTQAIDGAGGACSFLGAFADGQHVLALDAKAGTARVIGPAVLQTVSLGGAPTHAVLSPDDPTVMVALGGEAKAVLLTFDEANRAAPPSRKEFAVGLAADGTRTLGYDHGWIAVPNALDRTVSMVETAAGQVATVAGGAAMGRAHMGVWGGVARRAMVLEQGGMAFYEVPDGARTRLDLGPDPADLVGEENLRRAYVALRGDDALVVVDYDKRRVLGRVDTGKRPTSVTITKALPPPVKLRLQHEEDDDPREVWVGNAGDGTMTVVDANTLRVKAVVRVGQGPHRVAFSGTKAFVANEGDGTVSVVDRTPIR